MKKWMALVLAVLLGLTLCACAGKHTGVRDVSFQGKIYTIDVDAHTVSDGETTCTFRQQEDQLELIYRDGIRVTYIDNAIRAATGEMDKHWAESVAFFAVLRQELPNRAPWNWAVALLGLAIIGMGVAYIAFPEKFWRWQHWLTVEGGEPTDFALFANRLGGGLLVATGVLLLWAFVFGY